MQKDIGVKEMEERNTSALQQLTEMVDSIMGMGPVVTKHLYEKGLQMPGYATSSIQSPLFRNSDASYRESRRGSKSSMILEDVAYGRYKSKSKIVFV